MPVKHIKNGIHRVKRHILPHPEHKTRAVLLQSKAVLLYSLSILMVFSFLRGAPHIVPGILGYASNISVSDLLKYTNNKRATAGKDKLVINPKLSQAAQRKAEHMFKNDYWAHVAPDGTDPWSFIIGADYDYLYAGENLAKNFSTSKDVVDAWYKSSSHRENLLSEKYTEVGFASVNGVLDGYETTLVVQMFGRTRNAPAQVAVKGQESDTTVRPAEEPALVEKTETVNQPTYIPAPKVDVYSSTKTFTIAFAVFMFVLFLLDEWYSKRHAILKFTGHSFAHMVFLIFAITVIYLSLGPGRLI